MQRRTKGVVQLEWVCPNCQGRNPGPVKNCENCGAAQPENVQFQRAADEKLITDEKVVAAAKAGADIHCGFCGTRNPATAETCSQCGADLKEGKARMAGQVMQAAPAAPKVLKCSNCGTENPGTSKNCSNCGAPIQASVPAPKPAAAAMPKPAAQPKKKPFNWLIAGGIGAFLLMCCVALVVMFALPSRSVDGTVTDVYWKTSVPLQEVRAVNYSNERGNPPSGAYDVSCRTDSEEICEEKTIDKGNGYAEVVTECRTETEQYCSYTVDEWTTIQTYDLDGNDLNPEYADPTVFSGQRLGNSSTELKVYFDTSDGQETYSPGSISEFQQFQIGSQWKLQMNMVGGVVGVER